MKTLLKILGGLLIGIVAGLVIAAVMIVLFTDQTFSEFIENMQSTAGTEILLSAAVAMVSFLISVVILIPVHEGGHLVCGLLTGYKFVSFRIFNLTFIKVNNRLKVKKFSVAGTGGQCLLLPPDMETAKVPAAWYNAGGVLANIIVLLLVLPLFTLNMHPFLIEAICIFCITDAILILANGIPMKLGGISNDGYNCIFINRNLQSKQAMLCQLRSNALIQEGVRPKDMPREWFEYNAPIDYTNPLEVSIPLMHASRLVDEMRFDQAKAEFEELYNHKTDIIGLYVNEIACELAFCAIVMGDKERAVELLDSKLRKYIDTYSKTMSGKQRLLCAISLYVDNDKAKAVEIYQNLVDSQDGYLLQGEVKSDLAIMKEILK